MTARAHEQTPVIVGVGEVAERGRDPATGSEPLALMERALRAAGQDSDPMLLATLDSLDVVAEHSWPYADAPHLLSTRLGVQPRRAVYGETGGESPVRFVHEAALRIARGETTVAAVVGAESAYTVVAARKSGVTLPWTPRDRAAKLVSGRDIVHPLAYRHGVDVPAHVYPFYENAAQAHWGQSQAEGLSESGAVWSEFSRVAAGNPYAWLQKPQTPEEITTPSASNRLIAWPYTKQMVANPLVNQGAAVLLTSLANARRLGIDENRLVYLWGGAAANEPRDYLQRDQYHHSHAQDAVLEQAQALAGGNAGAFDFIELYSCFPCVPKMARRSLRLASGTPMTVTGGLSFFGAPLNNYMTHAAASIVRALRGRTGSVGLLYGQGEYVTKHHSLVLGSSPPKHEGLHDGLDDSYRLDDAARLASGAVPRLLIEYEGAAAVETFTVVYGREGQAEFGTVIARTPGGERLMARVRASDVGTLDFLTDLSTTPVGAMGQVSPHDDGLLAWRRT